MNARTKIRLESIEQAHKALEALPEHRPEELTKTQAIRRLIGPIRASQSKRYGLAAIGKVLSDCGIPITTGALRAYISDAATASGKRRKSAAKPTAREPKETQPRAPRSRERVTPAQATDTSPPKRDVGKPSQDRELDWEPAPQTTTPVPAPTTPRRSSFDVRPDTKDI